MNRLTFSIDINASTDKIWNCLWTDEHYRTWTSVFCEGSYAVSDWQEGSKVHFMTPSGAGMYSVIARLVPNEYMSFKHLGYVKAGEAVLADATTEEWVGAEENYHLKQLDKSVQVLVEVDTIEKEIAHLQETFPKALQLLKKLAEES